MASARMRYTASIVQVIVVEINDDDTISEIERKVRAQAIANILARSRHTGLSGPTIGDMIDIRPVEKVRNGN